MPSHCQANATATLTWLWSGSLLFVWVGRGGGRWHWHWHDISRDSMITYSINKCTHKICQCPCQCKAYGQCPCQCKANANSRGDEHLLWHRPWNLHSRNIDSLITMFCAQTIRQCKCQGSMYTNDMSMQMPRQWQATANLNAKAPLTWHSIRSIDSALSGS